MNDLIKIWNPVVPKPIPSAAETAAHEVQEPSFFLGGAVVLLTREPEAT